MSGRISSAGGLAGCSEHGDYHMTLREVLGNLVGMGLSALHPIWVRLS